LTHEDGMIASRLLIILDVYQNLFKLEGFLLTVESTCVHIHVLLCVRYYVSVLS
jgi:hypothetical protein